LKRTRATLLSCVFVCLVALLVSIVNAQANYTVAVTAQGLPSDVTVNVYVDGAPNGTLTGGQTRYFVFTNSSTMHIITVDFYVPNSNGVNGVRYHESDTSWGFNSPGSHVFNYTTQYYLTVQSSFSTVQGQGWYDSGTTAQATLKDSQVDQGPGTREVFDGWSGDASGSELTSNSITMNAPKTAIASWKTQFSLDITSDPPSVENLVGSGWYDANSQANFSAPVVIPANQDSRLSFTTWSGAYSGQSPTGSVIMDRPKVVTAHYIAQYLLTVEYDPPSIQKVYNDTRAGWYDANQNVQIGPAPTAISLSSVERIRFVGWTFNGTKYSDVSITITMDKPHKVVLSYATQYYVEVVSSYGSVSGSGWYDRDGTATITASSTSGTWPLAYTLTGWTVNPPTGKLTKSDGSWTLTVDRPYSVEAQWSVDYFPLLTLIGGIAVVAVFAAVAGVAYKRGALTRRRPVRGPAEMRPSAPGRMCTKCGNRMPAGAVFCARCGTPVETATPVIQPAPLEDKVYDYIVKHEGVISLSKASSDLGITVEILKEITEKLKKEGRLT
jgi:hypothetical protein